MRSKAEQLGGEFVALVDREAPWNPVAKRTLIETGPQVAAEMLNACGVSSERAPVVAFLTAAGAIMFGRSAVVSKLDQLVEDRKKADAEAKRREGA
jgi:Arc/MetJ family transcription regulator